MMETNEKITSDQVKVIRGKIYKRSVFLPLFLGLFVLLPAGTFKFWPVYVYFVILIIPFFIVIRYFLKKDPEFLTRRMKMKEKEKQQKIVAFLSWIAFLAGFMLPGFDYRYGWSEMSTWVIILGDLFVLAGYLSVFLVFKENSYASRVIEVVEGQRVISTGPYSVVRHPMYLGTSIMYLATPVALGSYWGIIPFAAFSLILVLRIHNEEKVLSEQLPGYKEYCKNVRYRMIPFIW
jgi:protein-S-isoprenylcysteine O-methyltransferase Ste14